MPGLDDDLAIAEPQLDAALDGEEAIVTGVDPLLDQSVAWLELHLEGHTASPVGRLGILSLPSAVAPQDLV